MKLTHIGVSHFRSIGPEPVMIDLSRKITVFVGQNDGGKSNVLRGLEHVGQLRQAGKRINFESIDNHKRNSDIPQIVHLTGLGGEEDDFRIRESGSISVQGRLGSTLEDGLRSPEIDGFDDSQLNRLNAGFGDTSYGHSDRIDKTSLITRALVKRLRPLIPQVQIIPQFRKIDDTDKYSFDGKGIVKMLADWQHPKIGQEHLKKKFTRVQQLLRRLLGREAAIIEVPPERNEIIVEDGTMRLPLESHGTGVHQLIILAIAVLSQDEVIFGIEEPEIHLHPLLQKRFMQFLLHETTNRYIITTHSPSLIAPSEDVDVIHLKMVEGVTIPSRVQTDAGSLAVLEDLGLQPSDLLQANSVIWVEGPSDRVYLNRWIQVLYPELVEGIDYSIMFYGGRLLSHLTMEREEEAELTDFIKLLRINQRSALIMDSDLESSSEALNATKSRIIDECQRNGVHWWVTDGREIENDLAPRTVEAALTEAGQLDGKVTIKPFAKFDASMTAALQKPKKSWCNYGPHKAPWAHRFAKHIASEDMSPALQVHVHALVKALCPQA